MSSETFGVIFCFCRFQSDKKSFFPPCLDAYTWKHSKVASLITDPSEIRLIGTNSAAAVINLSKVIAAISEADEQTMFADMFCSLNKDLLLITTLAEDRLCIEVTKEIYGAGLTACVDSWMKPDEHGEADATRLQVGDFLIVGENGYYCIRQDEFLETHIIG